MLQATRFSNASHTSYIDDKFACMHIYIFYVCCICLKNSYLGSTWSSLIVNFLDPQNYDVYPPQDASN